MPASATETSGPSLEQILWRALDRFRERPALVDAEEFADHVAHAFEAVVPEEAFADRFFAGVDRLHHQPPRTLAEAVVRSSGRRLHVYEFDLDRLEYVIVEDKEGLVVVSELGQFAVPNGDSLGRALEAALVTGTEPAQGDPRAWFVRKSGSVLALDVRKVARTLERAALQQVSLPRVAEPGRRLAPFHPVRKPMTAEREERALLQHPLLAQPFPPAGGMAAGDSADGTAQAVMGAATRWERMLRRGAGGSGWRIAVRTGDVLAIVRSGPRPMAGERALEGSEALAAVREGSASVAVLASPSHMRAFAALAHDAGTGGDRFWVQPEEMVRPPAYAPQQTLVVQVLHSDRIGPDFAAGGLAAGEGWAPDLGRAGMAAPAVASPALLVPGSALDSRSAAAVFAAGAAPVPAGAAGTFLVERWPLPVALARLHASAPSLALSGPLARAPAAARGGSLSSARAGALPVAAFHALQLALERTVAFGEYRLPAATLFPRPAAAAVRPPSAAGWRSRPATTLAIAGPTARLVHSLPFPSPAEMHVGADLTEALHAYLAAPVAPAQPAPLPPPRGGPILQGGLAPPSARARSLHAQAMRAARGAIATFGLPAVQPLVAGSASISSLPALLRRAVSQSGSWTAGPGALLPLAVRELADEPLPAPPGEPAFSPRRPPGPGEEEIVIPLPLWARMGRAAVSGAAVVSWPMPAPAESAPRPGEFRLAGRTAEPSGISLGAARGLPAAADVVGPAAVRVVQRPDAGRGLMAPDPAQGVARVPPGPPVAEARRRLRVGAPLAAEEREVLVSGALEARRPDGTAGGPGEQAAQDVVPAQRAPAHAPPAAPVLAPPQTPAWAAPATFAVADEVRWSRGFGTGSLPATAAVAVWRPHPRPAVALRFRYVGSPSWWAIGPGQQPAPADAAAAVRAGLAEANVAAGIWRSILAAPAPEGAAAVEAGDVSASPQAAALSRTLAAPPAPAASAPAYIVMSSAGAAGAVPARAAALARAQAIEMSIVAAVPPAPPPLETMGSAAPAAEPARARRVQDAAHGRHKEAEDAVSRSKIEGSVDAIAQRIYHRIRRRLQSDRERFGG